MPVQQSPAGIIKRRDRLFNVRDYGAKGDTRVVTDAVLVNGSPTVTSATAAFTQADVGKVVYGHDAGTGTSRLPIGTITAVNSATSITASTNGNTNLSGVTLAVGTDDSDAIRAAVAAAKAASPPGKVVVPSGGYMFKKCLVDLVYGSGTDSIAFEGAGSPSTIFYLMPNYDLTTTQANMGLFNRFLNAQRVRLRGFAIDGLSMTVAGVTTNYYGLQLGSAFALIEDVRVRGLRAVNSGITCTATEVILYKVRSETHGPSVHAVLLNQCGITTVDCYFGNSGGFSVSMSGINGTSNTGYYARMLGGTIDESTSGGLSVATSTDVTLVGTRIYGPVSQFAATVDGTSIARFIGGEIIPFSTGNRSGLKVLAGGIAYLSGGVRLGYAGTGVSINNAGSIVDDGAQIDTGSVTGSAPLKLSTYRGVEVSPAQITADQNDYSPGSLAEIVRLTTDASRNVTGLKPLALTPTAGQSIIIVNVGANNIVLVHESASSVAANRFHCTTGADITLAADQEATLRYDATTARWRVSKRN